MVDSFPAVLAAIDNEIQEMQEAIIAAADSGRHSERDRLEFGLAVARTVRAKAIAAYNASVTTAAE